jgi:uncharacterized protein YdcH (DUF465 family)
MDREQTDKRIDDFAKSVDQRFDQVDQRFDQVDQRFDRFEGSVDRRFDKIDARIDRSEAEMKAGFAAAAVQSRAASEKLDDRMAAMNRTVWAAIVAAGIAKLLFG